MSVRTGALEFIQLGSNPTEATTNIACLTDPDQSRACEACKAALTPEGFKNVRRNASAVIKVHMSDGT
jgi:hypothetical protein